MLILETNRMILLGDSRAAPPVFLALSFVLVLQSQIAFCVAQFAFTYFVLLIDVAAVID